MSQREIQIDNIITQMNLSATLNSIFAGRIYWGKPISDVQTGIYAILNVVSKPIVEEVYAMVRMEVRIMAHNTDTRTKTLVDAKNAISDYLESTYNHNGFKTYKITEAGGFFNALDDKLRNVLVQDYFIYFTKF